MSVAALDYRLSTLTALLGVVEALRSLTAAKQQKALSVLPAIDGYAVAAQECIRLLAPERATAGDKVTIVLGPDAGFTGGLAGRLAAAVPVGCSPLVVGSRLQAAFHARSWPVITVEGTSSRVEALPALATKLTNLLPADAAVAVISAKGHEIVCTKLPPLATRPGRHDLLMPLPGEVLLAAAGQQDREARLLHLLVLNHVAEQMARLTTLTGARERIRDRCASLSVELSMARQDGISQEIADLWAGRRVLQH
ncbi:hypothetical protein CHU95_03675 [Niveispirillum lacus]|uniref:Uncharacterized protein n=1 Tax=Niveispirillum lacus TaxID=1981099 RepID=A0A255Z569_9PROT|nr:F0F1 ATP synthase subunit gamma [Niveispirillum lacus]OYQ36673.1 hypothetical protein CHU95_03675 [Niveispirillum lacus]